MERIFRACVVTILTTCLAVISCNDSTTGSDDSESSSWQKSLPEEQGLNADALSNAYDEADARGFINSILIVRNGFLVGETYFNGFDKYDAHNVRSVSKSFLSALVGIALRENFLESLDQKLMDFFPEYDSPDLDPRIHDITIKHLLTMKAGFDHDTNILFQVLDTGSWMKSTIELPLIFNPGEGFSYSTLGTHLLSGIITKATDMSTLKFAKKYLFEPLRISVHYWEKGPQGYYFGGSEMHFTPRAMAKFGSLYLNGGFLNGKQIIPADWVEASLRNTRDNSNSSWGDLTEIGYGYLWWLGTIGNYHAFIALGHAGQYIINIPELNMIIVVTSYSDISDWDQADSQERSVLDVVANYVLPAVVQ